MNPLRVAELPIDAVVAMREGEFKSAVDAVEEENLHSEVVVLKAKRTGNPEFVNTAEALHAGFLKAGYCTDEIYARRKQLARKMREYMVAGQPRERMKG